MQALSVGEILWDVFPDKELLGGAPLNFSANSARLGNSVALINAVGKDDLGKRAQETAASFGVNTSYLQTIPGQRTGVALVTMDQNGDPHFEIPRPAAFDFVRLPQEILDGLELLKPDWLYYGTLAQTDENIEQLTKNLVESVPGIRCFYDLNLRPGSWNLPLVERLCQSASVLKLNEVEAKILGSITGTKAENFSLEGFCAEWSARHNLDAICVTLGEAGCFIFEKQSSMQVPGFPAAVEDTVGAGDAFAAGFLHGYHQGWTPERTARFANALGSIVASRPGATPKWSMEECIQLASKPLETSCS